MIAEPALEVFPIWHIEYPPGGMSAEELAKVRSMVAAIEAAVVPPARTLHFAYPGNINPGTWKAVTRAHGVGWLWHSGQSYRMDRSAAQARPKVSQRYLASLSKAFPEQAQKLREALAESEGPRPELTHRLAKTASYDKLFPGRPWVSPAEALVGTGGFAMFCVADTDAFIRDAAALTGRAGSMGAQGASFVIPVFTRSALGAAPRETLRAWFRMFELYILEYGYGEGLLIASRHDLRAIVEAHCGE